MLRAAFYKGTHSGLPGIYNRLVRWWTRSPYSHAEVIFSDGMAASSSFMDGGVRFKQVEFDPGKWDIVEMPGDEVAARQWFMKHEGDGYDLLGNVGFVLQFVRDGTGKWSCAESVAAALGFDEAWRFSPAILHTVVIKQLRKAL